MKYVYFIAETKGSMREVNLREKEKSKIACASRHFASLSSSTVKYDAVTSYDDLYNIVKMIRVIYKSRGHRIYPQNLSN
jgi:type III restriction enzyme